MTIQNTNNGTSPPYTYSQYSAAVDFDTCEHSEVRNLSALNIYQKVGNGSDGGSTDGILYINWSTTASIHGVTCSWARTCLDISYEGSPTALSIYNNSTNNHVWGISFGANTSSDSVSNVNIYGNSIGPNFDDFSTMLKRSTEMESSAIPVSMADRAG